MADLTPYDVFSSPGQLAQVQIKGLEGYVKTPASGADLVSKMSHLPKGEITLSENPSTILANQQVFVTMTVDIENTDYPSESHDLTGIVLLFPNNTSPVLGYAVFNPPFSMPNNGDTLTIPIQILCCKTG